MTPYVITSLADRVMRMNQGRLVDHDLAASVDGDPVPVS